jgi:hypothetical protein
MTVADGQSPARASSYVIARQRKLRRTLETYGPLTQEHLCEAAHASTWRVPFEVTLRRAVQAQRVRQMGSDLFEAGPEL